MQIIIFAAVALTLFVGAPVWIWLSLRRMSLGQFMYGPQDKRKSTGTMGNALQELNRLLTKPSIEYKIEAEYPDKLMENEKGGD
jgi:hypothetical protein